MRYPLVNVPRQNFKPIRLGGLLDDYNENVSNFKDMLSKQNAAAQKKYEQEHAGEQVYHPPVKPNITSPVTTGAGTFAGGEPLDTGAATFAGGGLLSGTVRLRRSHDLGAPAFSRPIRMARRPW